MQVIIDKENHAAVPSSEFAVTGEYQTETYGPIRDYRVYILDGMTHWQMMESLISHYHPPRNEASDSSRREDHNSNALIEVSFKRNPVSKPIVLKIEVPQTNAGIGPFPRDREIMYDSAAIAVVQLKERIKLSSDVGAHVASAVLQALSHQDTINGYAREELNWE